MEQCHTGKIITHIETIIVQNNRTFFFKDDQDNRNKIGTTLYADTQSPYLLL